MRAALLFALVTAFGQLPNVRSSVIDAPQLIRDLQRLSADDMEGRLIGTPGGEKARAFVVRGTYASVNSWFSADKTTAVAVRPIRRGVSSGVPCSCPF